MSKVLVGAFALGMLAMLAISMDATGPPASDIQISKKAAALSDGAVLSATTIPSEKIDRRADMVATPGNPKEAPADVAFHGLYRVG